MVATPARLAAGVTPAPSIHSIAKSRGRYFALGLLKDFRLWVGTDCHYWADFDGAVFCHRDFCGEVDGFVHAGRVD